MAGHHNHMIRRSGYCYPRLNPLEQLIKAPEDKGQKHFNNKAEA
jgi:hypothetical protein